MPQELPSFDLVVATVGRAAELERLLETLVAQSHKRFRVLVVDQGEDERVTEVLARHADLRTELLRSPRGLSRARNAALAHVEADVVTFPDDDCRYPPDLLERVAARFRGRPELDGLAGRTEDDQGRVSRRWSAEPGPVTRETVWYRANSASLFLRSALARRVGAFDERLGLGSGTPWSASEEIDYLLRALAAGAAIEYDPSLVVRHPLPHPDELPLRVRVNAASIGYVLRKHRYPARTVARMLVRPLGGAALALLRGDLPAARVQTATLRGRIAGYRGGRPS